MTSTFWGLRLEPGKRYSTTVDKSFHVSMAALDCSTGSTEKEIHCVMLEEGESNTPFILCNLQKPTLLQSRLNLNFESGSRITFFCRGTGTVHLTGYIIPDDDFAQFGEDGEEAEEEEDEEEEVDEEEDEGSDVQSTLSLKDSRLNGLTSKRKRELAAGLPAKKKKKGMIEQDSGEESDEEDDEGEDETEDSDEEEEELEEIEGADSDLDSETETQVEEKKSPVNVEQPSKKKKKNKQKGQNQQSQSPAQQQQGKQKQANAALNGAQQNTAQQKKKQAQQDQVKSEKQSGPKKVVEGGVSIQELKIGNGPVCKPGKLVSVYYTGRLKSNNKVFDQSSQGEGFKFRVGRGEVIKGWDVGLAGMKVGGKRTITCPPNMAYGQKGMPPTIPGNSTLVFEVELKGIK